MSKTKKYLMLLAAIGLIATAAGGVGTFAGFNAEVTNSGNSFATGTLILNDSGGTNTCTSAGDLVGPNSNSTDCDTLFKLTKFTFGQTTLSSPSPLTSAAGASAVITVAAITGAAIYKGDTLTITQGANSDSLPVTVGGLVGATSLTVNASGLVNSYTSGATIVDKNDTYLANLTLTNAGSINASGIKFENTTSCTAAYTSGHTTLNMGTVTQGASSGTTLTFATLPVGAFKTGDTVVVSQSGHANAFIAASNSTATTVTVTAAQPWNFAYTTAAVVSGPELNGASPQNLCGSLAFSITETTSAFDPAFAGAVGCAYGSTTAPVATNACDLGASPSLTALPSTLTALTLGSGAGTGNTGTLLSAGGSRYFLLAVHYGGPNFNNTYQNTQVTSINLRWHIDQV